MKMAQIFRTVKNFQAKKKLSNKNIYKQLCPAILLITCEASGRNKRLTVYSQRLLWFGCRQQQKRHVATPPTAGVWRRMERNRQKLVGRDKGSLTETVNKGKQEQQRYR